MKMNNEILNLNDLEIDKENEDVKYNDKLHKYWTKEDNQFCISVTTLIHKFTTFDEDFWSSYKALESLVSEDDFLKVKTELLNTKKFNVNLLSEVNIIEDEFNERKKEILLEWQEKREASCVRGTAIHKQLEDGHLSGDTKELHYLKLGGSFKTDTSNRIKRGTRGIYPELLLSRISPDGKLRLAGQADLIIIDGDDVYILDYKTSKKIDTKSYFDRKTKRHSTMKYPLNNIQDVNFWHYTLQLSTYAWMIQKIDPNFNIKMLLLFHYDHDGKLNIHECEYRKNDVERMLAYYKKQIEYEDFKADRQKIIF